MTSDTSTLPRWDMTTVFPDLRSPEFEQACDAAARDIAALAELFDAHEVGRREPAAGRGPLLDDEAMARVFAEVVDRYNAVLDATGTLEAYVYAFVSTDSRDDQAQAALSELLQQKMRLAQLDTRFTAWVGSLDAEALIERSPVARDHAFLLHQARQAAAHQMSPAEEDLAAELGLSGGTAWFRLHQDLTSQIMVRLELDGEVRELPMSEAQNLAYEPDREVRRRAHEAQIGAWQAAATPLAAALNGVKGETNALAARRRWETPLDAALFDNRIDRQTLDALLGAIGDGLPDLGRYLRAKARVLGLPLLAWYDMVAPRGGSDRAWAFDEAAAFIVEQFGTYSPALAELAARAFDLRWIDAEPRPGKGGGAFCMPLRGDESRVFTNYKPAYLSMSILAHELGHAYHNLQLAHRTPLQRRTPMTRAETASIFCETIVQQAALRRADENEQLAILDGALQSVVSTVTFTAAMFRFERDVFAARRQRELSIGELNEMMLNAQQQALGDAVDPTTIQPYVWAGVPHLYIPDLWFYNFPYAYGLLFGLGLYARYEADPAAFRAGYDDLLASTGLADAATLAARFGIDVRSPDFWRSSFAVVRADIDRFEELVGRHAASGSQA